MPWSARRTASSGCVSVDRIFDMTTDRFSRVKTSAIAGLRGSGEELAEPVSEILEPVARDVLGESFG